MPKIPTSNTTVDPNNSVQKTLFISTALLLLFFFGCMRSFDSHYDKEKSVRRKIENLKPNVVRIIAVMNTGDHYYGFGIVAGEVWNKDKKKLLIATANHNLGVDDIPNVHLRKVYVVFYPCQGNKPVEASPTNYISEDVDLTVLAVDIRYCPNASHFSVPHNSIFAWRQRRFSRPRKAEPVWFIGKNKAWKIPEKGTIDHFDHKKKRLSVNIGSVYNGTSGAPLINQNAQIIGMIVQDNMAGQALAISAEDMKYLFEHEWNLPFGVVASTSTTTGYPPSEQCDPEDGPIKKGNVRNKFGMRFIPIQNNSYIQKTEVTQCQWEMVTGKADNPSHFVECGTHCPVENVSWRQVQAFVEKLNSLDNNYHYRLPTEAEWEYACHTSRASHHNSRCRKQNGTAKSTSRVIPLPLPATSVKKVYNLIGNVREWCQDVFVDAPAPSVGHLRAVRGGGWRSPTVFCSCDARDGVHEANIRSPSLGFRLILQKKTTEH